ELRADRASGRCARVEGGDAAQADAQSDHAVEIGGNADRAADVVALRDRPDAGRDGRAGAAAGTAGGDARVERVQRAAVQRVVGEDAHGEGRRVGAADDDR